MCPATPTNPRRVRVLVADDDPALLSLTCEVLAGDGFEVEAATDGREALRRALVGEAPDVLLLDHDMPHVDGCAVTARLREAGVAGPVVMMSGSLVLSESDCLRLGIVAVLRKPVPPDDLVAALHTALEAVQLR